MRTAVGLLSQVQSPRGRTYLRSLRPALARAVRQCLALEGRIVRDGLKDMQAAQRAELTAGQEAAEAADKARRAERRARRERNRKAVAATPRPTTRLTTAPHITAACTL